MILSDAHINSRVRGVFARHWIDLQKVQFASSRGAVRISGELCFLDSEDDEDGAECTRARREILEYEIKRIRGVKRVHFDTLK